MLTPSKLTVKNIISYFLQWELMALYQALLALTKATIQITKGHNDKCLMYTSF